LVGENMPFQRNAIRIPLKKTSSVCLGCGHGNTDFQMCRDSTYCGNNRKSR
jgi:hypothetical protein